MVPARRAHALRGGLPRCGGVPKGLRASARARAIREIHRQATYFGRLDGVPHRHGTGVWHPAPKIIGVGQTLRENWTALEADFQRFYGLNLAEVGSTRRLVNLLEHLPPESSVVSAHHWSYRDEIAAISAEIAHASYVAFLHVHTDKTKRHQIPKPIRLPRPGRDTIGTRRGPRTAEEARLVLLRGVSNGD